MNTQNSNFTFTAITKENVSPNKKLSKDMFIDTIRKFLDMDTTTAPLIHKLIDHIDVYEAESEGKNKTQRVVIHYNFVCYLEIPENDEPCFTADTRQGVAIRYIAKQTEKAE